MRARLKAFSETDVSCKSFYGSKKDNYIRLFLIYRELFSDTHTEAYCYEHKTENRNLIGHIGVAIAYCGRNFYADF